MVESKIIMLGTGTPNPDPQRKGPSTAIVVGNQAYLIDAGAGCMRQAELAHRQYALQALSVPKLDYVFLTHLHSDHTLGLPDVIFTPWVLERSQALKIFGPPGTKRMVERILEAWQEDIAARRYGLELANEEGIHVIVKEIDEGVVFEDDQVKVEAFRVSHPPLFALGYRFSTPDRVIVISGDTGPSENLISWAQGCDVLIHEVISARGVEMREAKWRKYHKAVHTNSHQLGMLASKIGPKTLVLYHQLFMASLDEQGQWVCEKQREKEMMADIKEYFQGKIISAADLELI